MTAPVAAIEEKRLRPPAPTKSAEITQIGPLGKPVGAVVAAAKVLRVLHASERPLNASIAARRTISFGRCKRRALSGMTKRPEPMR